MNKKWLLLIIPLAILLIFWQIGGNGEEIDENDLAEPNINEESTDIFNEQDETVFLAEDFEYDIEVIGEGLEIPWEIVPLPDGRILVTERPGRVLILGVGEIYTVQEAEHVGEGGLLGIEISPEFDQNRHVFLYYTYREGNKILNRVSRFTLEENRLDNEVYILDAIPGARVHNGGRLKFGPDEKLYITTGDAQVPELSQDINSLAGKILRINSDGSIPEDNPFENSPVFAYGLRNPQGLAWHPISGDLFASDHGPTSQDEINLILPGANYGWPIVTCNQGDTEYEDPFVCYSDFTLAPSGIAFLSLENLSESNLYVAGLRGNMVMRIDLEDDVSFIRQEELFNEYGRIRSVVYHEGSLYIATNNRDGRGNPSENDDRVLKITPVLPTSY
ncbi:glucose/arabinose dehydrogenase [Acetoanaerobium pronyense]|uniref:Glucose/arabinose dehydrogenase n=1 Tax=Acetoanaerobium pronyense TaxID=1482736 RepID=A0ABS4KME8_9FIRM|nr:PQQ-dependent sugar dehydrogenase [Acetoanaerobium pronyense]MBP2028925.1 glucose/arabinose dehydrogenase [Acetoanaerobium pronyense]